MLLMKPKDQSWLWKIFFKKSLTSLGQGLGESGSINQIHQDGLEGTRLQGLHQVTQTCGGALAQSQSQERENEKVVHLTENGRLGVGDSRKGKGNTIGW